MKELFLIECLYNNIKGYCLWFSDDKDGLLCDGNYRVLCFPNKSAVQKYLSESNLYLQNDETAQYDFDKLEQWTNNKSLIVDCVEILNFWNMFTDFAYTTYQKFIGDKRDRTTRLIYDKLFYGTNLLTPEDEEHYFPDWDLEQINMIKSVMKNGLDIVCSNLAVFY